MLRRLKRRLADCLQPRAVILVYHRVAELPADPQLLSVTPEHFAEHLSVLRNYGTAIQVKALGQWLDGRSRDNPAIIVSFDDGYADNLYNAKPLLARYEIPATVFVTSGYVGSQREFWYDELEMLLLSRRPLPETLELTTGERSYRWDLTSDRQQCFSAWNVSLDDDPTPRHRVYRELCEILQPRPDCERRAYLDRLARWAGVRCAARHSHRTMSADELLRLADGGLIEIGAHTVSHPLLAALPAAAQRDEIRRSKERLEELLGRSVGSFAYPFGRRCDYTADSVEAVRQSGFDLACANFPGVVRPRTDRWQLPRFLVRDWDGNEFARNLEVWTHA